MTDTDKYDVLEKIGHGSFGVIRKVRRRADGMILCRKEISYLNMSQKEREQLHTEFQILSTLHHVNIVGYYHREHLKSTQDLHLYMEFCGNGDLGRVIRDLQAKNQFAEESFVWSIFAQLVDALYLCHYGVNPPEVGNDVLGLGATAKPKAPTGGMTILHRDLKPENVFLGQDNSVKLGDFGLAKVIAAHDFASTFVGTPFYMSPEICAAEKYTLKSDIWSLGCIMYELCTREPPFNAKSHYALIQKIKEGKVAPLPSIYSPELGAVVKDCLKVNPDRRPDTAALLNLPVVRLMRKEKQVVDLGRVLKEKEEQLNKRICEVEKRTTTIDAERAAIEQEVHASLRREWEVKARLEIDRLVKIELEILQAQFETEVHNRVEAELAAKFAAQKTSPMVIVEPSPLASSTGKANQPFSSVGTGSADGDFPSTTDLTELSVDGFDASPQPVKTTARTPFGRAQTMFTGPAQPMSLDVDMTSPSPMAISSLSLSPRRGPAAKAPAVVPSNIFAQPISDAWNRMRDIHGDPVIDSDSDDDFKIPSPTRNIKSNRNPFAAKDRHAPVSQITAAAARLKQPSLPPPAKTATGLPQADGLRQQPSNAALRDRTGSPNRRLSKIPSAVNLLSNSNDSNEESGPGPTRKPSVPKRELAPGLISKKGAGGVRGRTLVELQQARAGGRPINAVLGAENNISPKRAFKDHIGRGNGQNGQLDPAPVWDPDRDEMPSPFLVRRKPLART